MQAKEHKVLDRAAMIEAASRSLRQQMRARDRPRSKGSLHDTRDPGAVADPPEQPETSKRRIHSAENKYRMVQRPDSAAGVQNQSASSSALESYQAEEEPGQTVTSTSGPGLEDVPPLGELKRPMSRKKVPSASAAAGLGACSNPVKMENAFEQRKTRQPIPIESWGPRPPSRHRLPPNATLLDVSLLDAPLGAEERVEPKLMQATGTNRSRSEPNGRESVQGRPRSSAGSESVSSSTKWAAARYPGPLGGQHHSTQGLNEPRRGRKAPLDMRRGTPGPEDLGILGVSGMPGTRSPNGQLQKSLSGVFDHHSSEFRDRMSAQAQAAAHSGSWAAHVDTAGALEVSGSALGEDKNLWLMSSPGSHSIPTRKSRPSHPEAVSVEDVEADQDPLNRRTPMYQGPRDTPPQVIVTRSSAQKKERGDMRRGRDDRLMRGRQSSMPFSTSLDVDFLSLFAL